MIRSDSLQKERHQNEPLNHEFGVPSLEEKESLKENFSQEHHNTPTHKSKKLIVKIDDYHEMSPQLEKTKSAMLSKEFKLKIKPISRFRRMSTLNHHKYNQSLANNYEFKDLKELAKTNEFNSSMTVDKKSKLHGRACCFLGKKNKFRKIIKKLVDHSFFDYFILFIVLVSSVTLAIENPLNDPNSTLSNYLEIINITITFLFLCESVLLILTFGFLFNGKSSYLRNSSNLMNFFIVVVSLISIITSSNLAVFKAIRILRLLKPLRMIQRNEGLKVAIQALFMAIPNILYVSVISMLFFAIFGMTGVNMFKGKFFF